MKRIIIVEKEKEMHNNVEAYDYTQMSAVMLDSLKADALRSYNEAEKCLLAISREEERRENELNYEQ